MEKNTAGWMIYLGNGKWAGEKFHSIVDAGDALIFHDKKAARVIADIEYEGGELCKVSIGGRETAFYVLKRGDQYFTPHQTLTDYQIEAMKFFGSGAVDTALWFRGEDDSVRLVRVVTKHRG